MSRARRLAARLVALTAAATLLASCTWAGNQPGHPERKAFTVGVTEPFNRLDPAANGVGMSDAMVLASFQRLLALDPGDGLLKPDAANCVYRTPVSYRCTLVEGLEFIDGTPVDPGAVKFSIERAIALDDTGEARTLFAALAGIETGPDTVVFRLSRPDNQFGYALAAPVASLVSPAAYRPDRVRPASQLAVGSGPYRMEIITEHRVGFTAYPDYVGFAPSGQERLSIQRYEASEFLRNAMTNAEVDVVWGGLDEQQEGALGVQVEANPLGTTRDGFRRLVEPAGRSWTLAWSPRSALRADAELRGRVADAVTPLRTDFSLLPPDAPGYRAVFGDATEPRTGPPVRVSLGFDNDVADEALRAERVSAALRGAGFDVLVQPDERRADLWLGSPEPATDSPIAQLLPWLAAPLPESADEARALAARLGAAATLADRRAALADLQVLSARDATVLPLWREDRDTWMGPGISTTGRAYLGPGGQLAVWGFRW